MNINLDFSSLESSKNINNLKSKLNGFFKIYNICAINIRFINYTLIISKSDLICSYSILNKDSLPLSKEEYFIFDNDLFAPYFGMGQTFRASSLIKYESNDLLIENIIKLISYIFKANKNEVFG